MRRHFDFANLVGPRSAVYWQQIVTFIYSSVQLVLDRTLAVVRSFSGLDWELGSGCRKSPDVVLITGTAYCEMCEARAPY